MNTTIGAPAHPGTAESPADSDGLNDHTRPSSPPAAHLDAPESLQHNRHQNEHERWPTNGNRSWNKGLNDSRAARAGMGLLLGLIALGVATILLAPVALSSRDLLDWAAAPSGLGLPVPWPILVILALDAAAIACVLMSVLCTWRGEKPGIFGLLVWVFATTSAFANWRHGMAPAAPPDRFWFIPLMSLTGPGVLEVVLHRARSWSTSDHASSLDGEEPRQDRWTARGAGLGTGSGRGAVWQRWVPGLGSFSDTFGTYRTWLLTPGIGSFEQAVTAYRQLCPDGSVRVAAALRRRHLAEAQASLHDLLHPPAVAAKATGKAGGNPGGSTVRRTGQLPVDLMKRIPVQDAAFGRWITAWGDLRGRVDLDGAQIEQIADRHGFSTRQIGFIRRAGEAGLLDSTTPPAVRLAQAIHAGQPDPTG